MTWLAALAAAALLAGTARQAPARSGDPLDDPLGSGRSSSSSTADRSPEAGGDDDPLDMQSDAYVRRPSLNRGLPPADPPVDLETPQASLANFVDACERQRFDRAAYSMNLNDLPDAEQAEAGPRLARMLHEVLEQKLWIDWRDVPDRPDGRRFGYNLERAQGNDTDRPRPFYHLGTIGLGRRDVDVYLERVKVPDRPPVWVISRRTIRAVPELHDAFGPRSLELRLPPALRQTKFWGIALWQWAGLVVFSGVSLAVGRATQRLVERLLRSRASERFSDGARALTAAVHGPIAAIVGLVVFKLLASHLLRLAGPVMAVVEPLIFVAIVLSTTWLLSRTITFASARLTTRYEGREHAGDTHEMLTRIKVAKHFFTVVVLLAGLGVALWPFEWFQAMGYGLMASAGIAALILGLAAQRPLGNLFAGVQLALTQPVRVGDAVIFDGQWGWIEEIAVTYVVIRTWDLRRLVVPTAHLMDNPLENWTKGGENMMKPVYLYADYRVDVAAVRDELHRILHDSADWDRQVPPILQVTGCSRETVELRALCSAKDPPSAWNLHCEVRERLVAFLRDLDGGAFLPRTRVAMVDRPPPEPPDDPAAAADRRRSPSHGDPNAAEAAARHRIGGSRHDGQSDGRPEAEDGDPAK